MRRGKRLDLLEMDDHTLVAGTRGGDLSAFDELYRRHAPAAWRAAMAVTGNAEDAADAVAEAFCKVLAAVPGGRLADDERFRPYLLVTTRNAAIDAIRRSGRSRPTDVAELLDGPAREPGPPEHLIADLDASLVSHAFRSLPERWRSVLWLTEVEGMAPREAAGILGVSANGVSQLAVRARAGLRERYLQAHVRDSDVAAACRPTIDLLGAYSAGGLAPRDVAKVDQHLAACTACESRVADLEHLSTTLRRAMVPLPIALLAATAAKWKLAAVATGKASALRGSLVQSLPTMARKPLIGSSLVVLGLGIMGAAIVTQSGAPKPPKLDSGSSSSSPARTFVQPVVHAVALPSTSVAPAVAAGTDLMPTTLPPTTAAPATTLAAPTTTVAPKQQPSSPPASSAPLLPQTSVHASVGPVNLQINVGQCTGIEVNSIGVGCTTTTTAAASSTISPLLLPVTAPVQSTLRAVVATTLPLP